jgi:hypothetical protein
LEFPATIATFGTNRMSGYATTKLTDQFQKNKHHHGEYYSGSLSKARSRVNELKDWIFHKALALRTGTACQEERIVDRTNFLANTFGCDTRITEFILNDEALKNHSQSCLFSQFQWSFRKQES